MTETKITFSLRAKMDCTIGDKVILKGQLLPLLHGFDKTGAIVVLPDGAGHTFLGRESMDEYFRIISSGPHPDKSTEEMYYIQNGYIANALCFWAEGMGGYTADLNKAHKFSLRDVKMILKNKRPGECAWPCSYIDDHPTARIMIVASHSVDPSHKLNLENEK